MCMCINCFIAFGFTKHTTILHNKYTTDLHIIQALTCTAQVNISI